MIAKSTRWMLSPVTLNLTRRFALAIKLVVADKRRVPHARSLDRHIGRHNNVSGQLVNAGGYPDDFALLPGLRDAIPQRLSIVGFARAAGAEVVTESEFFGASSGGATSSKSTRSTMQYGTSLSVFSRRITSPWEIARSFRRNSS